MRLRTHKLVGKRGARRRLAASNEAGGPNPGCPRGYGGPGLPGLPRPDTRPTSGFWRATACATTVPVSHIQPVPALPRVPIPMNHAIRGNLHHPEELRPRQFQTPLRREILRVASDPHGIDPEPKGHGHQKSQCTAGVPMPPVRRENRIAYVPRVQLNVWCGSYPKINLPKFLPADRVNHSKMIRGHLVNAMRRVGPKLQSEIRVSKFRLIEEGSRIDHPASPGIHRE